MTTPYLPHVSSYETLTTSQRAALDALGLNYGPNYPREVRSAAYACYNHRLLFCAADAFIALGQCNNALVIHKRIRRL
jgi:hypothetical protein